MFGPIRFRPRWFRIVLLVVLPNLSTYNFSVERENLKYDVEASTVFVREYKTNIQPVIILAFAPNNRVGTVRRLARLLLVRHWELLSSGLRCPA